MVRINLINPVKLTDQHLIAEYNEILMLLSYVKNYPNLNNIPKNYCLGTGHIRFFKDKLLYLKNRHELLKKEMHKRGFATNKTINLSGFPKQLLNNWKPNSEDYQIIKERIKNKINLKPDFYRYYGKYKGKGFLISLLNN